ncbi:NAD(P)-dependent dehydrogenase (short-subunit alcohol dehydrogenase family) [Litorivivens lipolytica]|uniref:NAD(P)-dependent dehydrogenase (Short-subunit alcohol dehydrogenase family) n=1 Tax=Litorivivens lipolytica TaxID=1524264 RepID=A0A7W4W3M5_9GAMM|nr:SDR family oxidoreductase [Litorivivens lipolytica]MBB3046853.1 NAD(P)-dependent dehydrogenase (short-subunit alcohol dehydrogenase family) [Litorivivens lipolytica]
MGTYAMTGGATGIGAAIRKHLENAGHRLIVVDLKDADINADLSSEAGRAEALNGIKSQAGEGLDGFIACAGVSGSVPVKPLIPSVNYFGAVELVEGLRELLAARRGSVVLISSNSAPMDTRADYVDTLLAGDEAAARTVAEDTDGHALYSGSKQALARWMRRNTQAYAAEGIRLNAVAPGYTRTPMTEAVAKDPAYADAIQQFLDSIPLKRAGEPEDMAKAVSYLLSDDASFVCGSVLFVDGGHDAMLRPDSF